MSKKFCANCGSEVKPQARFCSSCGTALSNEVKKPIPKATAVPEKQKDPVPTARKVIIGLFALVVVILIVIFIGFLTIEEHGVIAGQPMVGDGINYIDRTVEMVDVQSRVDGEYLVFSLDDVIRHELVRVEYKSATATVPVLAYISPKGRLVTAISISEPCNATYFTIIGETIKCNNCPANWDLNTMQAYGCCPNNPPDPIPSRVIGNEIRVATSTLEEWRRRL